MRLGQYIALIHAFCAIIEFAASPVMADDGYAEKGIGGIVALSKVHDIVMDSELLVISPELVHVEFSFLNKSARDITASILFPLPVYSAEVPSFAFHGAPANFHVWVEQKGELPFKAMVKATYCGRSVNEKKENCRDITQELRKIGLTDQQIALYPSASPFRFDYPYSIPKRLTNVQTQQLLKAGFLAEGPMVKDLTGDPPYPVWQVSIQYLWKLKFPAGKPVKVMHDYRPFISGGSLGYASEATLKSDFCASGEMLDAWGKIPAWGVYTVQDQHALPGTIVSYILTSANTWDGPIHSFTLRLVRNHPSELVAVCFPGSLRHVDSITDEVNLVDFVPKKELRAIFVNTPEEAGAALLGAPPPGIR